MAIESRNPFNNEVIKSFKEETDQQIVDKIELAEKSYDDWRTTNFTQRKELMLKSAILLRDRKEHYASLMTMEMGKAKREAIAEIEKCALACDYYAENAEKFLSDKPLEVPKGEAYVAHDPIGIVLAIMPWNFPFWQVFRFAAPNLMAGNVGLLKHASNVPQCALAIEEVFVDAGFPKGCFQTLLVSSSKVNMILDDKRVKAATLTGSEAAGSKVAERAGKNLKKTVLELGGSDPFIVLKDADIQEAAKTGVKARMINNGQSCIAAKRFILEESIADDFLKIFQSEFENIKIGDPSKDEFDYGSMAREDLAKELEEQVQKSVEKGAKVLIGGKRDKAFFEPTVLTDVKPGMPAYEEELFGPVAVVLIAKDEKHAIELANDSRFGLGGSLWSKDIKKAKKLVREVESGAVYINKLMASHPAVPFGGIKMSGYGRELSEMGIKEFVNQKTVWVD
ncbi:succinate-semialdehyde dehydrogenase [Marivirga tractuosa]|uniref:Aldehyde Dehydrogenase n=1 Tax=Marivirga tractuosa (strain ATCC 23168 / DSM 4126 / NBRC 15989 / NCIMB 1408 / VKM B-1430 / H-43) TaxID=643867 RepID=E4TQQ0_MARTH|nr:NAD-dependent succinate-semialdehyde dehydrogenase [Marivirga tractuosa]ADR20611.1 Aldehyde Dehydrogenase [Marivirga tractuosa DSM 4126]BDD14939.1 succinate-semialdehyde dehydrogenase [Marivirga tractuosa]